MIECKYIRGRSMPISYKCNDSFPSQDGHYFIISLVLGGYATVNLNGYKNIIERNTVLFYSQKDQIATLADHGLKVLTVSFEPEFLNVKLHIDTIESPEYPKLRKTLNFPDLDIFLARNSFYSGILPLKQEQADTVENLFYEIIQQLAEQPDMKWSCRARTNIFTLFELGKFYYKEFTHPVYDQNNLAINVLEYLHLNLCHSTNIKDLCRRFSTNRTTLNREFKKLTGYTVVEYTIEKRIALAKSSLAFSALTIDEIAHKYDFYDQTYFTKVFEKKVGMTPTQYRKQLREARNINVACLVE